MAGVGLAWDRDSEYLKSVLEKYEVRPKAVRVAQELFPLLKDWAGPVLMDLSLSGSYAKGTATSLGTDVDVFVWLNDMGRLSIKDVFWGLFHWLTHRGLRPRAQNVSLRVEIERVAVDVVPARLRFPGAAAQCSEDARATTDWQKSDVRTGDHTLYWKKKDSWVQTNVAEHTRLVARSARTKEIQAIKIWREREHLDFASFYLELAVMDCLAPAISGGRGMSYGPPPALAANVRRVLQYLESDFLRARLVDPSNPNNVVSDGYGPKEKRKIATAARKSLATNRWESIVW